MNEEEIEKDEEQISTREEALAKISLLLANTKDEKILTDLDDNSINEMTVLLGLSDYFDISILRDVLKAHMRLRVSSKRKGRSELLEIAKSVVQEMENRLTNRIKSLFGYGGHV